MREILKDINQQSFEVNALKIREMLKQKVNIALSELTSFWQEFDFETDSKRDYFRSKMTKLNIRFLQILPHKQKELLIQKLLSTIKRNLLPILPEFMEDFPGFKNLMGSGVFKHVYKLDRKRILKKYKSQHVFEKGDHEGANAHLNALVYKIQRYKKNQVIVEAYLPEFFVNQEYFIAESEPYSEGKSKMGVFSVQANLNQNNDQLNDVTDLKATLKSCPELKDQFVRLHLGLQKLLKEKGLYLDLREQTNGSLCIIEDELGRKFLKIYDIIALFYQENLSNAEIDEIREKYLALPLKQNTHGKKILSFYEDLDNIIKSI